jgi:hypothetical protein
MHLYSKVGIHNRTSDTARGTPMAGGATLTSVPTADRKSVIETWRQETYMPAVMSTLRHMYDEIIMALPLALTYIDWEAPADDSGSPKHVEAGDIVELPLSKDLAYRGVVIEVAHVISMANKVCRTDIRLRYGTKTDAPEIAVFPTNPLYTKKLMNIGTGQGGPGFSSGQFSGGGGFP